MQNGQKIYQIRKARGFTQEFMCESLGISQSAYSKIESGVVQLSIPKIKKIAELLQVQVQEIIEESNLNVIFQPNFNDHSTNNGHFNYHQTQEDLVSFLKVYLQTHQEIMQVLVEEMKENRQERKVLFSLIKNQVM